MKNLAGIVLFVFSTFASWSQTLTVHVIGNRNNVGNIRFAFYNNSQGFDDDKPLFVKTISKMALAKNGMKVSYTDIKPGLYGIAVLDDENSNEKMEYGLVLPKEGFGFSDYYHTAMKRPKFESFDFILKNEAKTVEIKLRYL